MTCFKYFQNAASFKKEEGMMFSHKNKNLLHKIEEEIPELLMNPIKRPSNSMLLGLGVASFVSSALLDRFIKRKIWGSVIGVWGPLFLIAGLYSRMTKLEKELTHAKPKSYH
jgi:uncharacterized protein YbaR (Trm112 family)